jgi:hypothetical protein
VANFWTAGTASSAATAGWRYFNLNTQLYSTVTNTRTVQIRNGQLFGSSDSLSTVGIAAIGSEAGTGDAGIQKWIWNGTAWTHAYSILSSNTADTGYTGLAVQLDTTNDSAILWATTAGGARLEQFTDLLGDTSATSADASEITLATAPANDLFRGVALSPVAVPEPSALVLGAVGLASLIRARRRSLPY